MRQGLIKGVFQTKASSSWGGNKSERIQVSMCLPNKRDLDTWYEAVSTLPIAWPDITDIDTHYFKKTSANQLLAIRAPDGGVSHVRRDFTPMAPAPPSSLESWPWLQCRAPRGTAYPQPA